MRFSDIRALRDSVALQDAAARSPEDVAHTTFREPSDKTQPAPNRASRRANGQYRSHKRAAIRRAVMASIEAGHATPRDFLEMRGLSA